ncbi:unannotated protein [freshwater metagenome]|uniref:Unannotated protein n=1 Tax=freshwater metagenome TaxID=449393 RepID=A0A6J7TDR2_9ZZZZ
MTLRMWLQQSQLQSRFFRTVPRAQQKQTSRVHSLQTWCMTSFHALSDANNCGESTLHFFLLHMTLYSHFARQVSSRHLLKFKVLVTSQVTLKWCKIHFVHTQIKSLHLRQSTCIVIMAMFQKRSLRDLLKSVRSVSVCQLNTRALAKAAKVNTWHRSLPPKNFLVHHSVSAVR